MPDKPKSTTRTRSGTRLSTRRLSEVARHVVLPSGIATTGWPAVESKALEFGDKFDQWQSDLGRVVLGKRIDGIYAATVGGVTLSIPRQVAKTFIVGRIVFILCVLFPGLKVLWTAHRTRTATNTFRVMQGYAKRPKVAGHVADIRRTNGEQEILFANGSVLMFGAREAGFGRGFDEVDIEVFDEAQILTEKALEDMVAATNQSRHPHGALLFFMGTPPRPSDNGEAFSVRRAEALAHKIGREFGGLVEGEDQLYIECSADPDADPDDREQWAKANPSFPHRTPLRSMLRLRKNLPSVDSWMREGLGIWDSVGGSSVIDAESWRVIADPASMAIHSLALSVDVAPDRSVASVALAGQRDDGLWHVELDEHRAGTGWIVPWVKARCDRNDIRAVVVDGASPAASLLDEFTAVKVKVTTTGARDMANACAQFYDGVMDARFKHTDQPQVNVALSMAGKRPLGDAWAWNRKNATADITPVVAVTLALWGSQTSTAKKPVRRKRETSTRKAVVL